MIARLLTTKFSHRLVLLMLLATIPAMLGGTWILSRKATDDLRAAALERLASTAENLVNRVDSWVADAARDLQLLSRHPHLTGMDPARQRELLQQFRKIYPHVTYAHTIGPDGINVARSDDKPPIDYHDREYFRRVMAGAPIARETLLRSRSTGHPALNQAAPILDPADKVLGAVVVGIDLDELDDVVGAARYGRTGYSCVLDKQGGVLARPDRTYASTRHDLRNLPPVQGLLRERVSRSHRFQDERGVWWLAYAVPLTNGWSVVSFEEEAEVLAEADQVLALTMLVMGVVAVVMIGLTWLATRMMVRPIVSMTDAATKIANGDWTQRIVEDRRDELGVLAKAFNKMVGQLESTCGSLNGKVAQLSAALSERAQAEKRLQDIIEFLPDATFVIDADKRVIAWNLALEEMTGVYHEEMLGKGDYAYARAFYGERRPILIDLFDSDGPEAAASYDYVERRGNTLLAETYIASLYGGRGAHVWIAATPLLDNNGKRCGAIESVRDVSERKQAEEALRKKEEEFRQAQKLEAVGALAGGVAHEFNNLLQAIRAFTQFAMKGLSPDEARYQDLQEVLKASERAVTLTRQLLGFSRRQQLQMTDLRLNEILVDLKKMLQPLIGEKIDLQMSLADGVGVLHADPTMIQQVVVNLCINARDAMPSGGKLLIQTEDVALNAEDCQSHPDSKPGRYVRMTVSDSGTGIPPEVLRRIFEPFFSTKGVGKGTGLGLSMVYGAVQQHHGMIRVHSEPGHGATFEIYLPAADVVPEVAAPAQSVSGTNGGTETILIAEDDPLVRAALVRVLSEAGYRVLAAADGEEAVKLFAHNSDAISLVLLDMMMPKMGGREAHAQIAEINPDTPVVYCTGYDSGLAKLESAEIASLNVLQKPVDPEVLLSTIRELLDRRASCLAR